MSNFSWYSESLQSQPQQSQPSQSLQSDQQPVNQHFDEPRQFDQPQHMDQQFVQQQFDGSQRPFDGSQQHVNDGSSYSHPQQVHDFVLPRTHDGGNVYIHADNVIIQNGPEHSGEGPVPVTNAHKDDTHETTKTTTTSGTTGDKTKSTTVSDHKSDDNPLGVPSAHQSKPASEGHPPSNTSLSTTTQSTSDNKSSAPAHGNPSTDNSHTGTMPGSNIPPATNHGAPGLAAANTTAPGATTSSTTTVNHDGPAPPSTTTTTTADIPNGTVQTSANDHPPVGTKSEKKHKSVKERFREFKAKIHGGPAGVSGDVHPKDSRDGKTLPSQNELSQRNVTEPQGNSADHPVLHKDPNDTTGKSITGSDANPSKASMPFKVPAPSLAQPPIDAKAQ